MSLKDKCHLINFKEFGNSRGKLVAIEGGNNIPFDIKRIFYIYDSDSNVVRGQHTNKESEFVLINVSGKCKVRLSDGMEELVVALDRPDTGLYIPKMVWKDMYDFSDDAVLLCLSNRVYSKDEYINNIDELKYYNIR